MEKEIWKDIKGYEGLYQVSSYGRVRSLDRITNYANGEKHLWKGRILKLMKDTGGYLICNLCKNSKVKTLKVHRLVAQAFIPNPDNLHQVNHKDENKANNCVFLKKDGSVDLNKSNLEWCSSSYNINYGTRNKRDAEKKSKTVLKIDMNTNEVIEEYQSAKEASRQTHLSQGNISACCRGKQKTAYGYKWKYK